MRRFLAGMNFFDFVLEWRNLNVSFTETIFYDHSMFIALNHVHLYRLGRHGLFFPYGWTVLDLIWAGEAPWHEC